MVNVKVFAGKQTDRWTNGQAKKLYVDFFAYTRKRLTDGQTDRPFVQDGRKYIQSKSRYYKMSAYAV